MRGACDTASYFPDRAEPTTNTGGLSVVDTLNSSIQRRVSPEESPLWTACFTVYVHSGHVGIRTSRASPPLLA
jgi:hypothetical protein